jgi:hypothetical protein
MPKVCILFWNYFIIPVNNRSRDTIVIQVLPFVAISLPRYKPRGEKSLIWDWIIGTMLPPFFRLILRYDQWLLQWIVSVWISGCIIVVFASRNGSCRLKLSELITNIYCTGMVLVLYRLGPPLTQKPFIVLYCWTAARGDRGTDFYRL